MIYVIILLFQFLLLYILSRSLSRGIYKAFYKVTKSEKVSVYVFSILFLPGTYLHEMSHFITALFLFVPVGKFDLVPKVEEGMIRMGSVEVGKTDILRKSLIAISPFIFGSVAMLFTTWYVIENDLFNNWIIVLLTGYLVFQVGNTMFLSRKDVKVAMEMVLLIIVVVILLYLIGVNVSIDIDRVLSGQVLEMIKLSNFLLLIPITIDMILVGFTSLVDR